MEPASACEVCPPPPDHRAEIVRLNRVSGQIEGVKRMISEGAYCPDILVQMKAIAAALRAVEGEIMRRHLSHCLRQALTNPGSELAMRRIAELVQLYTKNEQ